MTLLINNLISAEFNLSIEEEIKDQEKYFARLKDIVKFEGIRDNILMGNGLIVGLDSTGDNLKNSIFTQQQMEGLLDNMGMNVRGETLKTKNVAAVVLIATLPPFSRQGDRIDIQVSALGDAKDLGGGILIPSTLKAADGKIYAVAQGKVSTGKIDFQGKNGKDKSLKTTGFITNGGIVEKEIDFTLDSLSSIKLSLVNSDISTSYNIAKMLNNYLKGNYAKATDPHTVNLLIPTLYKGTIMEMLADIENIKIKTDNIAKIIIDEESGTVIIGDNVKINPVAIAQGNITLEINNKYGKNKKTEPGEHISQLDKNTSLQDLVEALNNLGVSTRDLIDILHNIKRIGALKADIVVK